MNDSPVSQYETQDFAELLRDTDLSEYKICGRFFSWSNKGLGMLEYAVELIGAN